MKQYVIQPQKDGTHSILERQTDALIYQGLPIAVARERVSTLNSGRGFRGWTPNFILKGINRK